MRSQPYKSDAGRLSLTINSRSLLSVISIQLSPEWRLVRPPRSVRGSVGAGHYYGIAVRVPNPTLPVIWAAVTIRWVSVARQDNLDTHFDGALHDCFEIVDLKPKQHAVSVGPVVRIGDTAVMMLHFEAVQLKHKLAVGDQLFIGGASMIAATAKQTLVPPAARFDISHDNQRLRTHLASLTYCPDRLGGAY
jgi:hypothetical protein